MRQGSSARLCMHMQEGEAFSSMYEQAGILSTVDGGLSVLAGSTLGGGTRVNWSASFRTPAHVRRAPEQPPGLNRTSAAG